MALPVSPDQAFPGGRLSLVAHTPLSPKRRFDRPLAGLLIDEWVEVVPSRQETTGLTFHYDQPNSAAPQVDAAGGLVGSTARSGTWTASRPSCARRWISRACVRRLRTSALKRSGLTTTCPQARHPWATGEAGRWVRLHPRTAVRQGRSSSRRSPPACISTFPGRDGDAVDQCRRSIVCLRLPGSGEQAAGSDAAVERRKLGAPSLLGREPDRHRNRRHREPSVHRAAAAGRDSGCVSKSLRAWSDWKVAS